MPARWPGGSGVSGGHGLISATSNWGGFDWVWAAEIPAAEPTSSVSRMAFTGRAKGCGFIGRFWTLYRGTVSRGCFEARSRTFGGCAGQGVVADRLEMSPERGQLAKLFVHNAKAFLRDGRDFQSLLGATLGSGGHAVM